jgi:6-phosphogluconolactonase
MQAVVAAGVLCAAHHSRAASPAAGVEGFYIGTYTSTNESAGTTSKGIYQASLNLGAGTFGPTNLAATAADASFLAMHPNHKFLYAVSESGNYVSAYSINPTNRNLTYLNYLSTGGQAPVHLVVDNAGTSLLVANYNSGSVAVLSVLTNGSLGPQTSFDQHTGKGPSGSSPLCHCVALDASNQFAFVCDKGLDKVFSYHFNSALGTLTTNNPPWTTVATGSGPRHLAFDPQCQNAYVICELSSTLISFSYNAQSGVLTPFQTNSTLPAGRSAANNAAAEIAVHPSGRFVYGSNRANNSNGTNSIAVFTVTPISGVLTLVQQAPTGSTPRNFALDPTGAFCIVANEGSASVVLYSIDPVTGLLTNKSQSLAVSAPVCVLPFFTQPPQPVLGVFPADAGTLQVGIGNGCGALTYQLYQASALTSNTAWNLVACGACGQTNFVLTNNLPQGFICASVVTNY